MKAAREVAIDVAWEMGGKAAPRELFVHALNTPGFGDEGREFVEIMTRHIEADRKALLAWNEAG